MSQHWYVKHGERVLGPVTSANLKKAASEGRLPRSALVRRGENGRWVTAESIKGLFPPRKELQVAAPAKAVTVSRLPDEAAAHPVSSQPVTFQPAPSQPAMVAPQAAAAPAQKACMFCGETIAASAIKCRHCNEFLDGRPKESAAAAAPVVSVNQVTHVHAMGRPRWSPLVAAVLSFLIPGLGQMYKGQVFNGIVWFFVVLIGYVPLVFPGLILHVICVAGAATGDPYR